MSVNVVTRIWVSNRHVFTSTKPSRKRCDSAMLTRGKSYPGNHHLRNLVPRKSRVKSPDLLSYIPTSNVCCCSLRTLYADNFGITPPNRRVGLQACSDKSEFSLLQRKTAFCNVAPLRLVCQIHTCS